MAIEAKADQNGLVWLMGVYAGQQLDRPVFLGWNDLSAKIESTRTGTFYIGFDNRTQPALARIFYQPPDSVPQGTHTIGLIQFGQYSFQGEPLSPEKYSPQIDYKDWYRNPFFISPEHFWLDMMDPRSAYQLLRPNGQMLPPFYAYNGLLFDRNRQPAEFFTYGMHNGSLLKVGQQFNLSDSLAASLTAPVGLDLDVLDEAAIAREINRYQEIQDPIFQERVVPSNLDPIQYALALMNRQKQSLETNPLEVTPDIVESDIRWIKTIGRYLMIQFDDPEYVGGLICISLNQDRSVMTAYNFDTYTFEKLVIDANTHMFEQYKAYQKQKQAFSDFTGMQTDSTLRGRKSLQQSPFLDLGGGEIVVSFTHRTFSYAISAQKTEVLAGVQWEVSRKFDLADLQWGALEFKRPVAIWLAPTDPPYNLQSYVSLLSSQTPPNINPPSTPSIWFATPQVIEAARPIGFGERSTGWISS